MMFFAFFISCQPLEKIGTNCMEICMETLTYEFTTPLESYSLTVSVATTEGEDVVEVSHVDTYISTFSEISAFSPKFLIWSFSSLVTSDGFIVILIF